MKQDREKGGEKRSAEKRETRKNEKLSVTYYQTAGLANTGKTNSFFLSCFV